MTPPASKNGLDDERLIIALAQLYTACSSLHDKDERIATVAKLVHRLDAEAYQRAALRKIVMDGEKVA